jgi:hypothetical protein
VGLLLGSSPASAQSCPCPAFDLRAVVDEAEVIFVGKCLTATTDSTGATMHSDDWQTGVEFQTRLAFDVQTAVKGRPPRFVEVVTPTGACGFAFTVGETYLVAGSWQGAVVSTDICKGNVSGLDASETRAEAIRATR